MFLLGSSRPVSLMPKATKQAKGGDPVTATSLWDTKRYSSFKANGFFLRDGTAHSTSGLKFPVPTQVDQPWQNAKPFLFLHCFLFYLEWEEPLHHGIASVTRVFELVQLSTLVSAEITLNICLSVPCPQH